MGLFYTRQLVYTQTSILQALYRIVQEPSHTHRKEPMQGCVHHVLNEIQPDDDMRGREKNKRLTHQQHN